MIRIEVHNTETGEVTKFVGDDALVVVRDGENVTVAAEGSEAETLPRLCRDFFDAQEHVERRTSIGSNKGHRAATSVH